MQLRRFFFRGAATDPAWPLILGYLRREKYFDAPPAARPGWRAIRGGLEKRAADLPAGVARVRSGMATPDERPTRLRLDRMPAHIINLDRSPERWARCFRALSRVIPPERITRIAAVDGLRYARDGGWDEAERSRFQAEGLIPPEDSGVPSPDPTRVALCLSHQRALGQIAASREGWGLIFEDDAQVGTGAAEMMARGMILEIPGDADVVFLHDRTEAKGVVRSGGAPGRHTLRITRGGIGFEAYLVSAAGAMKMISAMRPMAIECDVQMMTFLRGYSDPKRRRHVHGLLGRAGKSNFPEINGYTMDPPLFQTDHWVPSVKFSTIGSIRSSAVEGKGQPRAAGGKLGIAVAYFNPMGYRSRQENFARFLDGLGEPSGHLAVAACSPGGSCDLPRDTPGLMNLTAHSVFWQKEALLNVAFSRLVDAGYDYLAWIDGDIVFSDPDWYEKTCDLLERRKICQLFTDVHTRFPDRGEKVERGAAARWLEGDFRPAKGLAPTGFCWAMRKEVWEAARLYDPTPVGGADYLMWRALFAHYIRNPFGFQARGTLGEWAQRWSRAAALEIGCLEGGITSLAHGPLGRRTSGSRADMLAAYRFDPAHHLMRNGDGLFEWTDDAPAGLVEGVRDYFKARSEDP